jgi:hypothetical protein
MYKQYITRELLDELGIALPAGEEDLFLEHLNEQLSERIGTEIASSLADDKLEEMLNLQQSGDSDKLGEWLQANVPELQQIAEDEVDILLGELADNADHVNAASQE